MQLPSSAEELLCRGMRVRGCMTETKSAYMSAWADHTLSINPSTLNSTIFSSIAIQID